jgi:hypothetical protein
VGNETASAQVVSDLITLTLAAQAAQASALQATSDLLSQSLAATTSFLAQTIVTTASIMEGLGFDV